MSGKLAKKVKDITFSVFDNLIDLTLFLIIIQLQGRTPNPKNAFEVVRILRGRRGKRAIWNAGKNGLVVRKGKYWQITQQGLDRINSLLPKYYKKRPWDGKVYLITYDIPEERKYDRDTLRDYLKRIGCGMLQASVWLTPYNPRGSLKNFLKERKLHGWVIISDMGKDGNIGFFDLKELMAKVYKLKMLNHRYKEFIQQIKQEKLKGPTASLKYLSILQDDPQLPFDLLPANWLGDRAYQVAKQFLKSISF